MYDENGAPNTVYYYNGSTSATKYYYVLNLQGDVTEIRSTSNALVAQYNYDAFGNILSIKDANGNNITSSTHIANVNPLRYRGYFYDPETGFYYLNSRYYDPATRRFISADSVIDTGDFQGFNLYAYCGNNPVMRVDPNGDAWFLAVAVTALLLGLSSCASEPTQEPVEIDPPSKNDLAKDDPLLSRGRLETYDEALDKALNSVHDLATTKGRKREVGCYIYELYGGYYVSTLQGGPGNSSERHIQIDTSSAPTDSTVLAIVHSHSYHNNNILYRTSEYRDVVNSGISSYVIDNCGCVYVLQPTAKNYMDYEKIK